LADKIEPFKSQMIQNVENIAVVTTFFEDGFEGARCRMCGICCTTSVGKCGN
jgi:hypothetical protein